MTTESQTQSELIRALQEELADKERELASQRRVFEQLLQSRSWRLTCRLRWVAKQLRTIKDAVSGLLGKSRPVDSGAMIEAAPISPAAAMPVSDPKKLFTSLSRTSFESFLVSEAVLELPSSPDPEVSIILVLFNRSELTFACLRSIAETYSEKIEVIIVDNASSDETRLLLDRLRGARIIRNRENRNFLLAVNQAAEHARGQYLLLLNNDAQLLPGSLRAALATLRGRPDIGASTGRAASNCGAATRPSRRLTCSVATWITVRALFCSRRARSGNNSAASTKASRLLITKKPTTACACGSAVTGWFMSRAPRCSTTNSQAHSR